MPEKRSKVVRPLELRPTGRRARASHDQGSSSQTGRATLRLREMLLDGHFQPGERIREVPLAAELGVSRIPLRLVLERLANEGFLSMRPPRGFVVQDFSIDDINDGIEIRGLLEGMAAHLTAELAQDDDVRQLQTLNDDLRGLVHRQKMPLDFLEQYIDLNARFHRAILDLADSRLLRRAMDHVCSLPFASPSAFVLRQYSAPDAWEIFHIAIDQHR